MLVPEMLLCCAMSQEVPSVLGRAAKWLVGYKNVFWGGPKVCKAVIVTSVPAKEEIIVQSGISFQPLIQRLEIPCGVSVRI